MGSISRAFIIFRARILALLTGAELEYEVYTIPGADSRGSFRDRSRGFYLGQRAECLRYIEEDIRSYHKVFYSYGVRPTGRLLTDERSQRGLTEAQES